MKTPRETCLSLLSQLHSTNHTTPSTTMNQPTMARPMASVEALEAQVLLNRQVEALGQIQEAIESMVKLQQGINLLCTLHGLNLRRIGLFELGMLSKEIEDLVFASQRTATQLKMGGLPTAYPPLTPVAVIPTAAPLPRRLVA